MSDSNTGGNEHRLPIIEWTCIHELEGQGCQGCTIETCYNPVDPQTGESIDRSLITDTDRGNGQ